jgi:hypothetical protein
VIVDRVEGGLAVVEISRGKMANVPVSLIDGRVRDGAVLVKKADGTYSVDEKETERRMRQARSRLDGLFGK